MPDIKKPLSDYEIAFNRHQEIVTELKNIVSAIKDLTKMYDDVNVVSEKEKQKSRLRREGS